MSNSNKIPSNNLPASNNLPIPINTLEPSRSNKNLKSSGLVRRLIFKNFGLKLVSVVISAGLWAVYMAFLE